MLVSVSSYGKSANILVICLAWLEIFFSYPSSKNVGIEAIQFDAGFLGSLESWPRYTYYHSFCISPLEYVIIVYQSLYNEPFFRTFQEIAINWCLCGDVQSVSPHEISPFLPVIFLQSLSLSCQSLTNIFELFIPSILTNQLWSY